MSDLDQQTSTNDPTLEALRAQVHAELRHSPRARPWWFGALAVMASNVALAACATMAMPLHSAQSASWLARWVTAAVLLSVVTLGAWFGVRPGPKAPRVAMLGLSMVAMVLAVLSGSGDVPGGSFWAGASCATTECVVSLVPLVVGLVVLTRFAFEPLRTAVVGLSSAAAGAFVLHMHCPNGSWAHLLVFHVAPWVGLTLGLLVFRRAMPSKTFAP